MAAEHGLATTGGSDYHGDDREGRGRLGAVGLPRAGYEALLDRAARAGCAQVPERE